MKSTLVLTSDALGRPDWADIGWPACDERLVTFAEANARRIVVPTPTPSSFHRQRTSQGQLTIRPFAKQRHR
jgi:hypothetical protein